MAGYKHPCRYCGKLIPPESNVCPICGRRNPLSLRCPKCKSPIEKGWVSCSDCGQPLTIICPRCGRPTFFGDYCDLCDAPLTVICPNPKCGMEQPPIGDKCIKCRKPLYKK